MCFCFWIIMLIVFIFLLQQNVEKVNVIRILKYNDWLIHQIQEYSQIK